MSIRMRRILAAAVGVTTTIAAFAWAWLAQKALYSYAWRNLARDVPLSEAGAPRPDAWDQLAHPYYRILVLSLLIAAGASTALIILTPRPEFRKRGLIYLIFLAIVLPATWYNYAQGDIVLPAKLQFLLNLVLIFLAATIVIWLSGTRATSPDQNVLKYLSLILLLFAGVCVPMLFSGTWLLYAARILTPSERPEEAQIKWSHITALGSLGSIAIAWLSYRRDKKSISSEVPKRIITP